MNPWRKMQDNLSRMAASDLLRKPVVIDSACGPRVVVDGREVVCLCSNDYLNLAADERIKSAAADAVRTWGVGAGGSRLVSGTTRLHEELQCRLAEFKRTEAALVASTGWMANHVAVHALAGEGDLILCDKLNHASILDAGLSSGATLRTYAHRDMQRLEKLLQRHRPEYSRCLIVTDTLFSMDGDVAPLRELADLKCRYEAQLLVDEAHATGVLGEHGRGAAELLGVEDRVDAVVGTLSKAMGSLGGFVAGPAVLIDTIVNTGRPYIYTTALPPALCAAAIEALRIIQAEPDRRVRLLAMSADLKRKLASMPKLAGNESPNAKSDEAAMDEIATQIMPFIVGEPGRVVQLSQHLMEKGFLVPAIRPPTVPRGTSRLRISLSAGHAQSDLDGFLSAFQSELEKITSS
jgi:8-amino-7-oxononanoate synthase